MQLPKYDSYKDSGVAWLGEIPEEWEMKRNRFLFRETNNRSSKGKEEHLSMTQKYGLIPASEIDVQTLQADSYEGAKLCQKGDLVLNRLKAHLAVFSVAPCEGVISPDYSVFKLISDKNHSKYFEYLFKTKNYLSEFNRRVRGIVVGFYRLYSGDFFDIPCLVPSSEEQKRIASYLDKKTAEIDKYISKKQELIAKYKEYQDVVTYNCMKDPSSKEIRFGNIASVVLRSVKREEKQDYTAIGIYNKGRGLFKKEPQLGKDLGESNFFWIQNDDLVFSGQFAWEGAVALASKNEDGCIASHRYPIVRGNPKIVLNSYLFSLFRTEFGIFLMNENSHGAAGRNRPLNIRTLLKEKIRIPDIEKQQQFVEMLQNERQLIASVNEEIRLINEYKEKLISDVVTGKIKV